MAISQGLPEYSLPRTSHDTDLDEEIWRHQEAYKYFTLVAFDGSLQSFSKQLRAASLRTFIAQSRFRPMLMLAECVMWNFLNNVIFFIPVFRDSIE